MQDFFRFATTELDSSRVGCARLAMALLRSQYGHDWRELHMIGARFVNFFFREKIIKMMGELGVVGGFYAGRQE